jgi:hypothetical protein
MPFSAAGRYLAGRPNGLATLLFFPRRRQRFHSFEYKPKNQRTENSTLEDLPCAYELGATPVPRLDVWSKSAQLGLEVKAVPAREMDSAMQP